LADHLVQLIRGRRHRFVREPIRVRPAFVGHACFVWGRGNGCHALLAITDISSRFGLDGIGTHLGT
jgi:hypothetical protein